MKTWNKLFEDLRLSHLKESTSTSDGYLDHSNHFQERGRDGVVGKYTIAFRKKGRVRVCCGISCWANKFTAERHGLMIEFCPEKELPFQKSNINTIIRT